MKRIAAGSLSTAALIFSTFAHEAVAANSAQPPIALPCDPSRACAIKMAREAGLESEQRAKGNFRYVNGLLTIVELQLKAGDKAGYTATAAEIHRHVEGTQDLSGALEYLARLQAKAGLFDEALATAAATRSKVTREFAYKYISDEFVRRGRWREALSARTESLRGTPGSAKIAVMQSLVATGRRDWVMDALPTLAPGQEAQMLSEVERFSGNLAAAREQAVKVADPAHRWHLLVEITKVATEKKQWQDLAAVARFAAAEGLAASNPEIRSHRLQYATEWLCAAGRFDEALALVPKATPEWQQPLRHTIALSLATAGQSQKTGKLLETLSPEQRVEVEREIAFRQALSGERRFDQALKPLPARPERMDALLLLGEQLPDSRSGEAREALRAAVKLAAEPANLDSDYDLAKVGESQAKRGFIDDAQKTAALIDKGPGKNRTINLLFLYGEILKAQAARGDEAGARKTLASAETLVRLPEVNGEQHAAFIDALAVAGFLPEAFAQIQALSRREHSDSWRTHDLDGVIHAHIKAGQLGRAFQIAVLASAHDYGNPHYFLEIATALKP